MLFSQGRERKPIGIESLAREVPDAGAREVLCHASVIRAGAKSEYEECRVDGWREANTVQRLLKVDIGRAVVPNRCPPGFAALANEHVTNSKCELGKLCVFELHGQEIGKVKVKPPDVDVAQVLAR